jgi:putative DNA primase/helicase
MPVFAVVADDGQVKRAAGRFAVIALAGELATEYGVTGWAPGDAIAAAGVGFAAWQMLRGTGKGNSERDQIAERIASFIERHGDSRFSNADAIDDDHTPMVRDRAGWWQDGGGDCRVYLFTADGMREAVKGFDFNRALDALQEVGAIDAPGADGKRAKFRRVGGRGLKLYAVNANKLTGVA